MRFKIIDNKMNLTGLNFKYGANLGKFFVSDLTSTGFIRCQRLHKAIDTTL